ncbi:UDP-N-acetylglucosamine 4,6-dehydratase (inverting) [Candidatus Peregrinibacteria bacterium]|nr:UDP-N-acetylglucosamine 4,6-dehydratase (inverting) [Candidatus Peregrinibacteria bacterium]
MSYEFLNGKCILVTGGTGSFGQKFVRILLTETKASRIIVFSRDELKQSQMQSTIADPEGRLRFFIGDVRDLDRLKRAFYGVEIVVHAAALKQVPLLEYNPFEAVKTNILGTQNIIEAAIDRDVKKVLLISTDKAANPANLYGATKLCAERLIISGNFYCANKTRFSAVRYGNVFGSRGSLIQIIEKYRSTGRLNLTHADMTRFWITLDQGVSLVLMAIEKMDGGEIFVPKIPSMKIKELITVLAPECNIDIVGVRPGEKLHEVLITPEEASHSKEYDTYYVILPEHSFGETLKRRYADGKDLDRNFFYSSSSNTQWLSSDNLLELIENVHKN